MLKLKLQYFGHLMRRVDSLEKTLMLGGIGGRRRRGLQKMRWLDGITNSMDMSLSKTLGVGDGQEGLACCDSWGRRESDTTERLNWTELNWSRFLCPWDFLVRNIGVGCHSLLQGIFTAQGSNPDFLRDGQILYRLSHQVSPQSWLIMAN